MNVVAACESFDAEGVALGGVWMRMAVDWSVHRDCAAVVGSI